MSLHYFVHERHERHEMHEMHERAAQYKPFKGYSRIATDSVSWQIESGTLVCCGSTPLLNNRCSLRASNGIPFREFRVFRGQRFSPLCYVRNLSYS